jgi:hypothetical protein
LRHFRFNLSWFTAALLAAVCWGGASRAAELTESWEGSPYRIGVSLAIDAPGELAEQFAAELPGFLNDRVNTAIGVSWRLKTDLAGGSLRHGMLHDIDGLTAEDVADAPEDEDKRLLLSVRATPWGYELSAREYDRYVERWGPTIVRSTRQRDAVAELLFELAVRAVAPLAHVRSDAKDSRQVTMEMRGAELPTNGPDFAWLRPGDVFQPLLRRTTRDGTLVAGGIATVPGTYVEVVAPADGSTQPGGRVRSIHVNPLRAGGGRIEQVVIGLRNDPGDSVLELRSRMDKEKPLVGYEVFAQDTDEKPLRSLGATNETGAVTVSPGKSAVQMIYVKSAGLTLTAMPMVPGAVESTEVWLVDDDMRLRAAARLASLREDIVDLVARRTIFMARVRQQIEEQNFDAARELLGSLDELPGQTQYSRALDREAQLLRSPDAQVQRRIDGLFAETRTALGKYLDPRPIGELHEEFRQAEESQRADKADKVTEKDEKTG